jgi:cyclase
MSNRTLLIARIDPKDGPTVADIFAKHDSTDLPRTLGLTRRTLFHYRGLYLHLVESEGDLLGKLREVRDNPLYTSIDSELAPYIPRYEPGITSLGQSRAEAFYTWTADA